tara:strand:- start:1241 stop:1441 length:201 start_codon:yes stop_codon:yes gene_type:complete
MATKSKAKAIQIDELEVVTEQYENLKTTVQNFIVGVDNLFKSNPTKEEVGSNLARYIAALEEAVKD